MVICSKCGNETREGKFCGNCGEPLTTFQENYNTPVNNSLQDEQNIKSTTKEIVTSNNNIETQNTQQDFNQYSNNQPSYNQYTTGQQTYNQSYNNFQQNNPNVPLNQKNKIVGLILNMLLVGLGYAYVGKWGEGIVLLVIYLILFTLGLMLIFPLIFALAIWVYSLIKTNDMIDKYNQGLPY